MSSNKIQLQDAIVDLAKSFGFDAHYDFFVDDEQFRITYRQFYSAPIQRALEQVEIDLEDCDKDEGGVLLVPLRRDGKALEDSRDALRLIAIWGEEKYRRFETAGGSPDLLSTVWLRQETDLERYQRSIAKSL